MTSKLEGYRTRIYAIVVALVGVAAAAGLITPDAGDAAVMSADQILGGLIVVIAGGIAFFRQITTKPVGGG